MYAMVIIGIQLSQHLAADNCFIDLTILRKYCFIPTNTVLWIAPDPNLKQLKETKSGALIGLGVRRNPGLHLICYLSGQYICEC